MITHRRWILPTSLPAPASPFQQRRLVSMPTDGRFRRLTATHAHRGAVSWFVYWLSRCCVPASGMLGMALHRCWIYRCSAGLSSSPDQAPAPAADE
ncbi:uncharacterized protein LY79DRAFT_548331 [Colletotrichum navitas]|uniref:Uncharacterized protein n=1 Tax=Colletotrichum navitas TaxID=681940 RepID=A0AAD8Q3A7_9PEZI|nr:uncharacterized protein LY79DRAFT_548331 [Colletotrichum navitas]KAK1594729.1 hypothetical protein LY79DRAFT_548331 [Colletotrichum navitas]